MAVGIGRVESILIVSVRQDMRRGESMGVIEAGHRSRVDALESVAETALAMIIAWCRGAGTGRGRVTNATLGGQSDRRAPCDVATCSSSGYLYVLSERTCRSGRSFERPLRARVAGEDAKPEE